MRKKKISAVCVMAFFILNLILFANPNVTYAAKVNLDNTTNPDFNTPINENLETNTSEFNSNDFIPDIAVDKNEVDFGNVIENSRKQIIKLTNEGTGILNIGRVYISNPTSPFYIDYQNVINQAIGIDDTTERYITILFIPPMGEMTYTGTLTIESNDPDESPLEISLVGRKESLVEETKFYALYNLDSVYTDRETGNSIDIDSKGNPHLVYLKGNTTPRDLNYTRWDKGNNTYDWITETIDTGQISAFSLTVGADDNIHIVYAKRGEGLIYKHWDGTSWQEELVSSGVYHFTDVALDSSNNPHILAAGVSDIYYFHWNGSSWVRNRVEYKSGGSFSHVFLSLDSNDRPHIAYTDGHTHIQAKAKYAYLDNNNWVIEELTDYNSSIEGFALDRQNRPHILYRYYVPSVFYQETRYTYWTGSSWETKYLGEGSHLIDENASLALDYNNNPHLVYYVRNDGKYAYTNDSNPQLKYSYLRGNDWHHHVLESGEHSPKEGISLVYDEKSGAHIKWIEKNNGQDRVYYRNISKPDITISEEPLDFGTLIESNREHYVSLINKNFAQLLPGTITVSGEGFSIVDDHITGLSLMKDLERPAGILFAPTRAGSYRGTLTIPANYYTSENPIPQIEIIANVETQVTEDTTEWRKEAIDGVLYEEKLPRGIAVGRQGNSHLVYLSGDTAQKVLKYARWNITSNSWVVETLDSGAISTASIAVDNNDKPHIVYDKGGTGLQYKHWDGVIWQTTTIITYPDVWKFSDIALDSNNNPHVFSGGTWKWYYAYWNGSSWVGEVKNQNNHNYNYGFMDLDSSDKPHIAYTERFEHKEKLFYAYLDAGSWSKQEISGADSIIEGLVLDTSDKPHILYKRDIPGKPPSYNQRIYTYLAGNSWQTKYLGRSSNTFYNSFYNAALALDKNNNTHLVYYNDYDGEFKYSYYRDNKWHQYTLDNNEKRGVSLVVDSGGNPHIKYSDTAVNYATVTFNPITDIDTTPPASMAYLVGKEGANGWHTSDVQLVIKADDDSGIKKIEFSYDGSNWMEYTAPFEIIQEGIRNLSYRSIDLFDNIEDIRTLQIKIDKKPPQIAVEPTPSPNADGWNNNDVMIHFEAIDNLSGVGSVAPDLTITEEGVGKVAFGHATDQAGNTAYTWHSLNIDKTPPVIVGTILDKFSTSGWYNGQVKVHFDAIDNLSGIQSVTPDITLPEGTDHSVTGSAIDLAGNTVNFDVNQINVDNTMPTLNINFAETSINSPNLLVTLDGADNQQGSGLEKIEYSLDGNTWNEYTGPFDINPARTNTIYVGTNDGAGNQIIKTATYLMRYDGKGTVSHDDSKASITYNLGEKIEVKFQLENAQGFYVPDRKAYLYVSPVNNKTFDESKLVSLANIVEPEEFEFTYDNANYEYVCEIDTGKLTAGIWQLRIELDDGSSMSYTINLQ